MRKIIKLIVRKIRSTNMVSVVYFLGYISVSALVLTNAVFALPDPTPRIQWLRVINQASFTLLTVAFAFSMIGPRAFFTLPTVVVIFTISAAVNVVSHAMVYQTVGLATVAGLNRDVGFSDALYFSIVTFTTLGYGDFQPAPELRIMSALQALSGYIFLGLLIGFIANATSAPRNRSD